MYRLVKTNARKACARITHSRITASFFVFSLIYCCAQITLQSLLFSVDSEYANILSGIPEGANIPPANFTYLQGNKGHMHLQMCNDIPLGQVHSCTTIYDSSWDLIHARWEKDLAVISKPRDGSIVNLNEQCTQILLYPYQLLQNFKDEDITSLCLQIWLLGISFIIILHGSVPHTVAALVMRTLATGWAVYTTWRGPIFAANFQELIAGPTSPCSWDLFSTYWNRRGIYEVTDFILSSTGLLIFSYLSWILLKVYNAESIKCVGAPPHVVRIQNFFMALLSILYLEVFILFTSFGLWHKNLSGTAVNHLSTHTLAYKVMYIVSSILLLPWITMGWYSIRHEMKRLMVTFLGIGILVTVGWSILFSSDVYRWGFIQWPYLACYTVVSFILLFACLVIGVICRMNFGKGLAQYLHAEATLASLNFSPGLFSHDNTITPISPGVDLHQLRELGVKTLDLDNPYSQVYSITLPIEGSGSPGHKQLKYEQRF